MEDGMSAEDYDRMDPIPDYKFLETMMDISQDPDKVMTLSNERMLLLLHLLSLGLYFRDEKNIPFDLVPELEEFLTTNCSDSPEDIMEARLIIQKLNTENKQFYNNIIDMVDFVLVEFLKSSSNLDDSEIGPGELKFTEQLFNFLEDPEEIRNFSDSQFLLLVSLLVYGGYLNEINALGFYLSDDITESLRKFTPTPEQCELLKHHISYTVTNDNDHVYESISALINYILYNFLKHKV